MDVICLKIKFMKRLLILVLFILAGKAYGQRYQGMPQRYVTPGMRIDSVLSIPIGITSLRNTGWSGGQDTGQIRYNKLDSSVYIYTGSQWLKVVRASAGTLQEVTDNGNSTSNLIRFSDGNNWDIGNNGQGSFIVQGSTGGAIELNDNGQLIVGGNIGTYMLHPPTTTGITDTIQNKSGTIALLSDIASQGLQFTKQQDTISLASFGAGSVALSDTLAFTTSAIYGSFYNSGSDTLVITSAQVGLQGTSPSINTKIWFNDSLNVTAGATALVNAGNTCTNIYTGTTISSFDNTKIPPGNWVWVSTPTVTTKPTYFTLTLIGYKSRR